LQLKGLAVAERTRSLGVALMGPYSSLGSLHPW
jgi:hypothetical protein